LEYLALEQKTQFYRLKIKLDIINYYLKMNT